MMPFPSFYPSPYYRNPYRNMRNYQNLANSSKAIPYSIEKLSPPSETVNSSNKTMSSNEDVKRSTHDKDNADSEYFEIFGLKLYFDDILLICMIFFLYSEGVEDQMLFISLILLLLS